jgi:hypothetical protein
MLSEMGYFDCFIWDDERLWSGLPRSLSRSDALLAPADVPAL